jgi:hypothetical protein
VRGPSEGRMAYEPTPETIDDQEARRRSVERLRQQAANGHAPPARRLNGANGHAPAAPAAEISWGPVIGQVAADCQREIAALKGQVAELLAKPTEVVATSMTDELIDAWARGTAPFIRQSIADAVAPLSKRIDEIESVVRTLVQSVAGRHE